MGQEGEKRRGISRGSGGIGVIENRMKGRRMEEGERGERKERKVLGTRKRWIGTGKRK